MFDTDSDSEIGASSLEDRNEVNFDKSKNENALPEELVPDWLFNLRLENKARKSSTDLGVEPLWIVPEVVEYIFTLALRLRLSHHVKYLALVTFNKFMTRHIHELYEQVRAVRGGNPDEMKKDWAKIECNVSRQIPLRVLSCFQIGTKFNSGKEILSVQAAQRCLQNMGSAYTEEAIAKSELRVLQTIGWCAKSLQNPIVYLESILALLVRRVSAEALDTDRLWDCANVLLDVVFLKLDAFCTHTLNRALGRSKLAAVTPAGFTHLKLDYLLISSGVISAACIAVNGVHFADRATTVLAEIINLPKKDVSNAAWGVVQVGKGKSDVFVPTLGIE